jgi:7-carboxy-7-deazaguanine synthase
MAQLNVFETFVSIQGESSYAGLTCFFIRLAGCNLSCRYCDTPAAREKGHAREIDELVSEACASKASIIEITGGEPLIQDGTVQLAEALHRQSGCTVLIETNGSLDISRIPDGVTAIVDVKTPGSGQGGSFEMANLRRLRPHDEVKFVLQDRADYEWAKSFVESASLYRLCRQVFFSPVYPASPERPARWGGELHGEMDAAQLASWMIEDGVHVRMQVQLHKFIGLR